MSKINNANDTWGSKSYSSKDNISNLEHIEENETKTQNLDESKINNRISNLENEIEFLKYKLNNENNKIDFPVKPSKLKLKKQDNKIYLEVEIEKTDIEELVIQYSEDGLNYKTIKSIKNPENNFYNFLLNNYTKQGMIFYRAYVSENNLKSDEITDSIEITREPKDIKNLKITKGLEFFKLDYDMPDDPLVEKVTIYKDAKEEKENLKIDDADIIYSGPNDTYTHLIKNPEMNMYHKFWVETHND